MVTVVVAATALAFAVLTALVVSRGGAPFGIDVRLHRWAVAHRSPGLTDAARIVTATGSGVVPFLLAAAAGAFGGGRRRWWAGGLAAAAALGVCVGLRYAVSVAIGRVRPPQADWVSAAAGYAFPSGHTTTATATGLIVCLAVAARRPARGWSVACWVVTTPWVLAVGLTRVYLGVHWPTDVIGGWCLGVALVAGARLLAGLRPSARAGSR